MKKRELNSITPNFTITDEEAEQLKRDLNDPIALEKAWQKAKEEEEQYQKDLRYMCETGLDLEGNAIHPYLLKQIKQHYQETHKK